MSHNISIIRNKYVEYGDEYIKIRHSAMQNENKDVLYHTITTTKDHIKIIPIGDVHFGHKNCDVDAFLKVINYIKLNQDVYCFLVGDLLETATKESIGAGVFEENIHVNEQISQMINILHPLAEQKKILGAVEGNHENRIYKMTGISPVKYICDVLKIPYQQYQLYSIVKVNNEIYKILVTHGRGGGSSKATKIKSIAKPAEIAPLMDLYITGHHHSDISDKDKVIYIDDEGNIKEFIRRYAMCGSFLKYFDSYSEQSVLPMSISGAPQIILYSNYHNISILN